MAVPSAVTRRKEADASALRAQGVDPDSGAPLAVQAAEAAPATPAPMSSMHFNNPTQPAPAPADESAALRTRITELEQQLSTQNGRTSSSATELEEVQRRVALLDRNREFLDGTVQTQAQRLQELERENEELRRAGTATGVSKVVSELEETAAITQKERDEFGDDTVAFIQKNVRLQMVSALKPIVEQLASINTSLGRIKEIDKLPALEKTVQAAAKEVAKNQETEFFRREVLAHFPDFVETRDTPEWKAYIHSEVPGRGIKIGQLLRGYQDMNNVAGIRSVLTGFYDKRGSKPTLSSLAVPAKTSADVPPTPAPNKMLSSEYKAKLRDMTMKRITKPEWEAYKAKWDAAVESGNVDYDVNVA